mgnify:CR=1 FL=1
MKTFGDLCKFISSAHVDMDLFGCTEELEETFRERSKAIGPAICMERNIFQDVNHAASLVQVADGQIFDIDQVGAHTGAPWLRSKPRAFANASAKRLIPMIRVLNIITGPNTAHG